MKHRRVVVTKAAARDLGRLPKGAQRDVLVAVEAVADARSPNADIRKLGGRANQWRLRLGSYRVLLELGKDLTVLRVLDRKEAYRR